MDYFIGKVLQTPCLKRSKRDVLGGLVSVVLIPSFMVIAAHSWICSDHDVQQKEDRYA